MSRLILFPVVSFTFLLPNVLRGQTPRKADVTIFVRNADHGNALELARVALFHNGTLAKHGVTDVGGNIHFRNVSFGTYRLAVAMVGFQPFSDTIDINLPIVSDSAALMENAAEVIEVSADSVPPITTIDPSGNQVFESENYHPPPSSRMTQLIQQNLMGAVRAPTGEVHIRGQHGEYSYFIDGAPVPLGVFGGLNEIVDPTVIERATFLSGGWPAEYGGQLAAIIDITTRVPTGGLQANATTYAGGFVPNQNKADVINPDHVINSDGQSLNLSDHDGPLGWFISGSRQETDRRIDSPTPMIFHDHGSDVFLFGKADYILSDNDYLTLDVSYGNTGTQVPYDSTVSGPQNDYEDITEAFQTLSYFRTLSTEPGAESNLQGTLFLREGGLNYEPGANDSASFLFASDTTKGYVIAESQSFVTLGDRIRYEKRLSSDWLTVAGGSLSLTRGSQNFTSRDAAGVPGPGAFSDYAGSEFGLFAETEWQAEPWFRADGGLRYDQQISPDVEFQNQLSPRLRLNFIYDEENSGYLYYGRLFMPTVIESLHAFASTTGATGIPTIAERDNFYEAVYSHHLDEGVNVKLAYYLKNSSPGVDDEVIGNSAVDIPFNLQFVKSQGIEAGVSYSAPAMPFSGYINSSISHAYSWGTLTGGFLPIQQTNAPVDRDHDQRLSAVFSFDYQPSDWFANAMAIYGSGLTNGNINVPFGTGLFDFNNAGKVMPSWILDVSCGMTIHLSDGEELTPSLYITNLLDHEHLLKGAYTNGAYWEEPRNIILKLALHV
jgi:hypothetical protein